MMTFEQIMTTIIAAAPAITALVGIITACLKLKNSDKEVINKFEEVRQEIFNTKEYEALKAELKIAHQENRELKKKINELLTVIDRVARKEEE